MIAAATSSTIRSSSPRALCRDRGRVVVVGDVGMDVPRAAVLREGARPACSRARTGPGRYDRAYEERGLDYPIGYVRWTERRNMGAFLDLVASEKIDVESLVTERVPVEQAAEAYERLVGGNRSPLGIVLTYVPGARAWACHRRAHPLLRSRRPPWWA